MSVSGCHKNADSLLNFSFSQLFQHLYKIEVSHCEEVTEITTCMFVRATSEDSGSYMCVATNIFNKTEAFISNSSVLITVKGQYQVWINLQKCVLFNNSSAD